jgi:hypothetical protein
LNACNLWLRFLTRAPDIKGHLLREPELGASAALLAQPSLQAQGHVRRDRGASIEDP